MSKPNQINVLIMAMFQVVILLFSDVNWQVFFVCFVLFVSFLFFFFYFFLNLLWGPCEVHDPVAPTNLYQSPTPSPQAL